MPADTASARPIRPDELYSLSVARRLTQWGDAAFRAARRAGLRVLIVHKRRFVSGAELIRYIESAGAEQGEAAQ